MHANRFNASGAQISCRFNTSGSMIPLLVPEISPCDGFCDEEQQEQEELGNRGISKSTLGALSGSASKLNETELHISSNHKISEL